MELHFAPLFSGSNGNSIYVGCDEAHLLVDAGLSGARVIQGLNDVGVNPAQLSGILVTHEHVDHIRGIGVMSRKFDLPVYASEGTWQAMYGKIGAIADKNVRVFEKESNFWIGPIEVMAFGTPHDAAESVGYAFELGGARFALATDVGCVKEGWFKHVLGAEAVLLESNYDPGMLQAGPYPYELKKRIMSKKGHLSNDDAAAAAVRLVDSGTRQLILGHLSQENNFPELALECTGCALREHGVELGVDVELKVAPRAS